MPIQQPCLDCGKLTNATRCTICNQPRAAAKAARRAQRKKETGQYGGDYKARAKAVRDAAIACHLCSQPFKPGDRIHADHLEPGNPASPLAAAHATCNQRRGAKPLGQADR
jgi:hypothetical protein